MKTVPAYDFTLPLDGSIRVRDYQQTMVLQNRTTIDDLQRISDLQFYPHLLTHIDLLPRIPWREWEISNLLPDYVQNEPNNPENNTFLFENKVVPCTIVLLDKPRKLMRNACRETWENTLRPRHPFEKWPEEVFINILENLSISRSHLEASNIPRNNFICFYTGWREFAPRDGDLTHPVWYPWHPYLMNPYLDEDAVQYLLSEDKGLNCLGIGCDIGALDSPLRYIAYSKSKTQDDLMLVNKFFGDCLNRQELCPSSSLPKVACFSPVHILTLSKCRLLIEQLHIPLQLFNQFVNDSQNENAFPTLHGKLVILPFKCYQRVDATLVSVIFTLDEVESARKE